MYKGLLLHIKKRDMMIYQSKTITIPDSAVSYTFSGSGGPGGQNVNRVATAVQLRLDLTQLYTSEAIKARLVAIAGSRVTDSNELLISARTYRTQRQNRDDALDRLVSLLKRAETVPKKRKATKPTRASQKRRIESKKRRSSTKENRKRVDY